MGRLRFLTAGESHGKGLVAIVEGMVADLPLEAAYINRQLKRRQQGYGRGPRMEIEADEVDIMAGVRHGVTMGSPIALFIANRDWTNWQQAMSITPPDEAAEAVICPRPGHADLAGVTKYGLKDIRPVMERASARETAARVAAGAVARRFLEEFGIAIHSHTVAIGHVSCESSGSPVIASPDVIGTKQSQRPFTSFRGRKESCDSDPSPPCRSERGEESLPAQNRLQGESRVDWQTVEASPVRCADETTEKAMMAAIDEAKASGDTLGGIFEVVASGVTIGLGSHVSWDRRLDARIAEAIMSINAVKGVEIGTGFGSAGLRGSQAHDVIEPLTRTLSLEGRGLGEGEAKQCLPWRHATNHAGGIEGGMSNGEDIIVRAAVKPIATLAEPLSSIDLRNGKQARAHYERSDVCAVPAAGVIAEAMLAIVLADAVLEKFGGDNLKESLANYHNYLSSIAQ
ncbi:MAG: chorismate synthase [Dehalococcoidia bacterium]|nr:chorismate synthase [Dehalococcoidia bacterium]